MCLRHCSCRSNLRNCSKVIKIFVTSKIAIAIKSILHSIIFILYLIELSLMTPETGRHAYHPRKVQVGYGQEMALSQRNSHSINRGVGKK